MSVVVAMDADEHAQVQALLPWYARGQLDEHEMNEVRQHLQRCERCRVELAAEPAVQTLLGAAALPVASGDADRGFARLQARLHRQPAPPPRARWMPWALGLQSAALALVLTLWLQARPGASGYEGLSAAGTPAAADVLVMFRPDAAEQDLRVLLQAQGASIVAGPTETGAYQLRAPAASLDGLRRSPLVRLAEPLQPGAGR
jgi:anti-sigma factor RsiW